jgi:hypothetical protein
MISSEKEAMMYELAGHENYHQSKYDFDNEQKEMQKEYDSKNKMKADFEEKFIVLNRKKLREVVTKSDLGHTAVKRLMDALYMLDEFCSDNKISNSNRYFVVNQDEAYAPKILSIILQEEWLKNG